jgi:hypothetical protein
VTLADQALPVPARPARRRRLPPWGAAAAVAGVGWLWGLRLFLAPAPPLTVVVPRRESPPAGVYNLAAARFGPTVRASSYFRDVLAHHHPLFAFDERDKPPMLEKWASSVSDPAPWIEISWREPRDLERVVIRHAGWVEDPAYTIRRYSIRCLGGPDAGRTVSVEGNEKPVAEHALACAQSRGIRLDLVSNHAGDAVRIYEIEAWGR